MRKFNYDHRMSIQHEEFDTRGLIAKVKGSKYNESYLLETREELELDDDDEDESITESEGTGPTGTGPQKRHISRKKKKEN